MIHLAKMWLNSALYYFNQYENDNSNIFLLYYAAYNLQSAIEHFLKGLLQEFGIQYTRTHELGPNIELLLNISDSPNSNSQYYFYELQSLFSSLLELDHTITLWYTKVSYFDTPNFYINIEQFENILDTTVDIEHNIDGLFDFN